MNKLEQQSRWSVPYAAAGEAAFTLIELLTVIAIIGVLMGLGAGMAGVASRKQREAATKGQLNNLMTAIESYKASFGSYPADNVRPGEGTNYNPALNSLYYELVGAVSANSGANYHLVGDQTSISSAVLQSAFNVQGILNSKAAPETPKSYVGDMKPAAHTKVQLPGVALPVEILIAPVPWPTKAAFQPGPLGSTKPLAQVNPWRYVATQPTNNPAGFDLWAEVVIGGQRRTFGNWKE